MEYVENLESALLDILDGVSFWTDIKRLDSGLSDKRCKEIELVYSEAYARYRQRHNMAVGFIPVADGVSSGVNDVVKCPFCNIEMQEIDAEYKCLNLQCALAKQQSIFDFTFRKNEIPRGV